MSTAAVDAEVADLEALAMAYADRVGQLAAEHLEREAE